MTVPKRKHVMKELALALFLMLEIDPESTAAHLIRRVQERARSALQAAVIYIGTIDQNQVRAFFDTEPLRFNIPCGDDIIKDDIIRFSEDVFDNESNPPRHAGKRSITAKVENVRPKGNDIFLDLRVIASAGVNELEPDTEIRRTLKFVSRSQTMRTPWDDEAKRAQAKKGKAGASASIKDAATETFTR